VFSKPGGGGTALSPLNLMLRADSTYGSLRAKLGRLQLTVLVRWRLARTSMSAPPISQPQLRRVLFTALRKSFANDNAVLPLGLLNSYLFLNRRLFYRPPRGRHFSVFSP